MANNSSSLSDHARKEGNDLYKAGKLKQAIVSYQRGAELDFDNAAPHSNLSAAYFELGEYSLAASACDAALERTLKEDDNAQLRQRLVLRKTKACIHDLQLTRALTAVSSIAQQRELQQLNQCVKRHLRNVEATEDLKAVQKKLKSDLPLLKPSLLTVLEFEADSGETPTSLFNLDDVLCTRRKKISLFFGTISDARHLYHTVMMLGNDGKGRTVPEDKLFHFTAVDVHTPAIARDVLILLILDDLSNVKTEKAMYRTMLPHVLYYVYLAPIMPRFCYDQL